MSKEMKDQFELSDARWEKKQKIVKIGAALFLGPFCVGTAILFGFAASTALIYIVGIPLCVLMHWYLNPYRED